MQTVSKTRRIVLASLSGAFLIAILLLFNYVFVVFALSVAPEVDQLKIMRLLKADGMHRTAESQRLVDAAFSAAHWKTLAMEIVTLVILVVIDTAGVKLVRRVFQRCRVARSMS